MNGWKNYNTWAVNLWLNNEEGTYKGCIAAAKEALNEADGNKDQAAGILGDLLKEEIEAGAPEISPSMYSDLLQYAINQTDFYEIAAAFIEAVK